MTTRSGVRFNSQAPIRSYSGPTGYTMDTKPNAPYGGPSTFGYSTHHQRNPANNPQHWQTRPERQIAQKTSQMEQMLGVKYGGKNKTRRRKLNKKSNKSKSVRKNKTNKKKTMKKKAKKSMKKSKTMRKPRK
jgi:hypothetical protein